MSSKNILFVDFGSTFTKVTAIDIEKEEMLGTAQVLTKFDTDIVEGMNKAIDELNNKIGKLKFEDIYASSSIDNGLRTATIGIVPHLSSKAARLIALDAGMKVVKSYSGKLTSEDVEEINNLELDMILVSGGTDGGNKDAVLYNASKLAGINKKISIIYAGNKNAAHDFKKIIEKDFDKVLITENVMPDHGILNVETVSNSIVDMFIERVRKNNRFSKVNREISGVLMPTGYSLLLAAQLLSEGSENEDGIGELMVIECDGSKTDVISIFAGNPPNENIKVDILSEPYQKRSIEELGIKDEVENIINYFGIDEIKKELEKTGQCPENLEEYLENLKDNPQLIPSTETECRIDSILHGLCVEKAVRAHVGIIERVGENLVQKGKDFTTIPYVIGTGEFITCSSNPRNILEKSTMKMTESHVLRPKNPQFMIDKENIMFAFGMLSQFEPDKSLRMMKKYIVNI